MAFQPFSLKYSWPCHFPPAAIIAAIFANPRAEQFAAAEGVSPMATRTKSRITPTFKTQYRVKNWATYEAALKKRGDVTLWFDEDAIGAWNAVPTGRAASTATPTLLS